MSALKTKQRTQENAEDLPQTWHPVMRDIYAGRCITQPSQMDYDLKYLPPYQALSGIDRAVSLLCLALKKHHKILVVADYDVDGATSCALAVSFLSALGAAVHFVVPDRLKHGYGISKALLEECLPNYQPQLVITVDNGITAIDEIAYLNKKAIPCLIIDHHLPGEKIPEADAIVNPQLSGDVFPYKNMAAVGVTFYVMAALRAVLRSKKWFIKNNIPEPNLAKYLDLVALGTIADQVSFDYLNRLLVEQGLLRMRRGFAGFGIHALLEGAKVQHACVSSTDLGFRIAPILNAAGRIDDMSLGIQCLLAEDYIKATELVSRLRDLNTKRKSIGAEMDAQAKSLLDTEEMMSRIVKNCGTGIVLYDKSWHIGIVGLLASRLKEHLRLPVVVLALSAPGTIVGSGRSIAGIHIRDVFAQIASHTPDLLQRFGGHAMAAGLTMKLENLPLFTALFQTYTEKMLTQEMRSNQYMVDGTLEAEDINLDLAGFIENGGPWGQGFPEPCFYGVFWIISSDLLQLQHLRLQLCMERKPSSTCSVYTAIYFNAPTGMHFVDGQIEIIYRLSINRFRGRKSLQLIIEALSPIQPI